LINHSIGAVSEILFFQTMVIARLKATEPAAKKKITHLFLNAISLVIEITIKENNKWKKTIEYFAPEML
jgi:hypothetical protein